MDELFAICERSLRLQNARDSLNLSFFQLSTGLAACTDCDPGYYSSAVGSTFACRRCDKGKHANTSGSVACEVCPAGRYGNDIAETRAECAGLCAEGHYGDEPGATSRQCAGPCPMGSYSRPGASECRLCPEGRYGNVVGSGIVGYTTPVCSGPCNFATYYAPQGSTCCPPNRGWVGNCPGDWAPSPSPSSSSASKELPISPSPSNSTAGSPSAALGGALAGLAVLLLIVAACAYFALSRGQGSVDAGQGEANQEKEELRKKNEELQKKVEVLEAKEKEKQKERENGKGKAKLDGQRSKTKANQVLPASATVATVRHPGNFVGSLTNGTESTGLPHLGQDFALSTADTQDLSFPQKQTFAFSMGNGASAYDKAGQEQQYGVTQSSILGGMQSSGIIAGMSVNTFMGPSTISSQTTFRSEPEGIFMSCQAKIGLWRYIEIAGGRGVERRNLLGRGSYAEIYAGVANGIECAIKKYRSTASQEQLAEAMREIQLGASLDHPCTLRILGWVRTPLQAISELCSGDLTAFYEDKIKDFAWTESQALRLLKVGRFSFAAPCRAERQVSFPK